MSDIEPGPPRSRIKHFSYKIRISDKNVKVLWTYRHASNLALVLRNTLSTASCMRDPMTLLLFFS